MHLRMSQLPRLRCQCFSAMPPGLSSVPPAQTQLLQVVPYRQIPVLVHSYIESSGFLVEAGSVHMQQLAVSRP